MEDRVGDKFITLEGRITKAQIIRTPVVYFYPILGARKGARYPKSGKNIQQIVTFFNFFMKKGYNFLKKGICWVKVTPRRPFEG
jgi:hypothetical protein